MLRSALLTALGFCVAGFGAAQEVEFHVSPDGDDAWSGRLAAANEARDDGPLRSLPAAADAVRAYAGAIGDDGVAVVVHGGDYLLEEPLRLGDDVAGDGTPYAWRVAEGDTVRVRGARIVEHFEAVNDTVRDRLDASAADHVMQADLKALGITDYGSPKGHGLSVIVNDTPMTLARWPNDGFVEIQEVFGEEPIDVRGTKGDAVGKWRYEGERPERWTDEAAPWVHGYWFWDWSDERHAVKSIDAENKVMEVAKPYHGYGYRKGQWYYAYNLLSEIDAPGEWYLDRESGVLYLWPPAPLDDAEVLVTVADGLVSIDGARNLTIDGFVFEGARRGAVRVSGGESVTIRNCTVRHIGDDAVTAHGGKGHRVAGNELYHLDGGAIGLRGGDRASLSPAGHEAVNNHIHHYGRWFRMYKKAVSLNGVGLRAAHNHIHDAPHMAIGFGGNEHVIEYNEIHHVCLESNDAGALYAGRDWSQRGTVIRHNFLHHIQGFRNEGCVGVYLDDMFSGTEIVGNVFYRVTRAAFIGGGRDVTIANNVFVDCDPALHVDARAMNWASYHVDTTMTDRLKAMPYRENPWKERYPELATLLDDEPAAPKGNRIVRNVAIGGRWDEIYDPAREYVTPENNVVVLGEAAAPVLDGIAEAPSTKELVALIEAVGTPDGFAQLPVEKMGLVKDK